MGSNLPQGEYESFFQSLKERIQHAQLQAALSINRELSLLYWHIGREILQRQQQQGWGAKVIERLAKYLKKEFPDMTGFSRSNLLNMRAFAEAYPDEQLIQNLAGQIPWGHNMKILERVKDPSQRLWYIQQTIEHGWSRNVLVHQIESGLHDRWGSAVTNFDRVLPQTQSDLAVQILKDPVTT
jgi:predicted nuclease of restriction endonuclease-like (RecB) superfamily